MREPDTQAGRDPASRRDPATEAELTPEDFEQALRRMKRELALTGLRRSLQDPSLEAAEVMAIVRRILALQAEEQAPPRAARRPARPGLGRGLDRILQIVAG